MTRDQLEHIIRAAAVVSEDDDVVVIGSQAVLGQFPDAPAELLVSTEADVWPRNHPDRWELVDGTLGELSPFHDTFGYYAQGVGPETAILPSGWEDRLVPVRGPGTRGATGWCLEIHDLLVSKYVAGRDKDLAYASVAARHGLAEAGVLNARLALTAVPEAVRARVAARIRSDYALTP